MENRPKISVLIPVYNVEKYIAQCLESVVNQTYKNLEIIIVDDCGQDKSMDIVQFFAKNDARIAVVHHTKNLGLAIARNSGLQAANGEYLCFLDSDDYMDSAALENMFNNAIDTNADIVISQTVPFADDQNEKTQISSLKKTIEYYNYLQHINCRVSLDNFAEMNRFVSVTSWGKLFKMKFIGDNKLRFIDDVCNNEDQGFHIKYLSCFPLISTIDAVGVFYRMRNNSVMHSARTTSKGNKIKITHVQKATLDAMSYIKNTKSSEIADALIDKVKNLNVYIDNIVRTKPFYFICTTKEIYIKAFGTRILTKRFY